MTTYFYCGPNKIQIRETGFKGLGYAPVATGNWRFFDLDGAAQIGRQYATKAELLADVDRFADERGFK